MAHFAELDADNIVQRVVVIADEECLDSENNESEAVGIARCQEIFGADTNWKQTSYNSWHGEHKGGGTAFRKNYASVGYTYSSSEDAFIPPKPDESWVYNSTTGDYDAPISRPADCELESKHCYWDEEAYQADNTAGWVIQNSGD